MNELYHYNHNHDHRTGRFTTGSGGFASFLSKIIPKRYVDRDGNLTEEGLKRYGEILKRDYNPASNFFDNSADELDKKKAGFVVKDGVEYVKNGSTFTRYADESEALDHKRKYVSLTEQDSEDYGSLASEGQLGVKDTGKITKYQFEARRDLKVANEDDVKKYLYEKYGDTKVSDLVDYYRFSKDDKTVIDKATRVAFGGSDISSVYKDINKVDNVYDLNFSQYSGKDKKVIDAIRQYATTRQKIIDNFYHSKLATSPMKNNPTLDRFAKLGYDAIVDIEDSQWAQYPLILIDPAKSVKKKG